MQHDRPYGPPSEIRYGSAPGQPFGPPQRRQSRRSVFLGALIGAGSTLAVVAGVGGYLMLRSDADIAMVGSLTLSDVGSIEQVGGSCAGSEGYGDIVQGAGVTVYDASGKVIASGSLGPGIPGDPVGEIQMPTTCRFPFMVRVPSADYYGVEVSHRGKVTFTRSQVKGGDVVLTLGN